MAQVKFYRYIDATEHKLIIKNNVIAPAPGQPCKYYTPDRYDIASDAQRFLAMSYLPAYRIGPIPSDEVPDFDYIQLRPVAPANGQPVGGTEAATTQTLYLFEFRQL